MNRIEVHTALLDLNRLYPEMDGKGLQEVLSVMYMENFRVIFGSGGTVLRVSGVADVGVPQGRVLAPWLITVVTYEALRQKRVKWGDGEHS